MGKHALPTQTQAAGMVSMDVGQQDGIDRLRLVSRRTEISDEPTA
jgi:hypothetical protein